jgi:hypothetical protein
MEEGRLDSVALRADVAAADCNLNLILAADVDVAHKLFSLASMLADALALAVAAAALDDVVLASLIADEKVAGAAVVAAVVAEADTLLASALHWAAVD